MEENFLDVCQIEYFTLCVEKRSGSGLRVGFGLVLGLQLRVVVRHGVGVGVGVGVGASPTSRLTYMCLPLILGCTKA